MNSAPSLWRERLSRGSVNAALLLMAMDLGGSFYEHLVVDPVWTDNVSIIQPDRGGVDRKMFWIPLHAGLTLALPLALWAVWRNPSVRRGVLVATGLYIAMRVWTFVYFVPWTLRFESAQEFSGPLMQEAQRWVLLSLFRAPLVLVAVAALWIAARTLVVQRHDRRHKADVLQGGAHES